MKKLSQFIKSGKGRGLKLVFWTTLCLSLLMGMLTYYTGVQFFKHQLITNFVDSIPTFVIKDGVIQNNNLKWAAYIPMTHVPVVIDTTQDTLPFAAMDGLYVTRTAMFSVADHGTRIDRAALLQNQLVSPAYIYGVLRRFALSFGIGIFIFSMIVSWLAYLFAVALTALFAWLLHAKLAVHRAWRVAAVTWSIGLAVSMILAFGGLIFSTWYVSVFTVIINVIILARLKN